MKYPVIEIDKTWPERDLPRNFCAAGFLICRKTGEASIWRYMS